MPKAKGPDSSPVEIGFFEIGISDGSLKIAEDDALSILSMIRTPGFVALLEIMRGMKESCDFNLRDKTKTLDEIRYLQGQIGALSMLANIVTADIPKWYADAEAAKKAKSDAAGPGEGDDDA